MRVRLLQQAALVGALVAAGDLALALLSHDRVGLAVAVVVAASVAVGCDLLWLCEDEP